MTSIDNKHIRKGEKGEQDIIVTGLQTDYCIDATVKCGFEHGFHVIVPATVNSTVDNAFMTAEQSYQYYNEFIWKRRYAECISFSEMIRRLDVRRVVKETKE